MAPTTPMEANMKTASRNPATEIERIQTGVRIERRLLKVLKGLAEYLGLSPATVSLVVNNAPGAKTIAPKTRERVLR